MTEQQSQEKYRYRLVFAKQKQLKYIAHLDLMLAWERALRRAGIPLAYSQGYNPRPKMQAASGLPLGTTGRAEIIDIITTAPLDPAGALSRIRAALPAGIALHSIEAVPLKAPTLQHLVRQAEYTVTVETDLPAAELERRIQNLLAADSVIQTRRRRQREEQFDLRPLLHDLRLLDLSDGVARLFVRVTAGQYGNLRPQDVLVALGLGENWAEIDRTRLIFQEVRQSRSGQQRE